jgi:hypothetical protein
MSPGRAVIVSAVTLAACGGSSAPSTGGAPQGDAATATDGTVDAEHVQDAAFDPAITAEAAMPTREAAVDDAGDGVDGTTDHVEADFDASTPDGAAPVYAVGAPCSATLNGYACPGTDQQMTLTCEGGVWTYGRTCEGTDTCDTMLSGNHNMCEHTTPFCTEAGVTICYWGKPVTCGPDGFPIGATCNVDSCTAAPCGSADD